MPRYRTFISLEHSPLKLLKSHSSLSSKLTSFSILSHHLVTSWLLWFRLNTNLTSPRFGLLSPPQPGAHFRHDSTRFLHHPNTHFHLIYHLVVSVQLTLTWSRPWDPLPPQHKAHIHHNSIPLPPWTDTNFGLNYVVPISIQASVHLESNAHSHPI